MDEKEQAEARQNDASGNASPPPPDQPSEGHSRREKMSISDKIMSIATIVIAIGTLVSAAAIVMQWREMVGGGKQTDALIEAAKTNACAAKSFAASAASINTGVENAVQQLDAQAKATQQATKAAKSAADTARESLHISQRAYLSVVNPGLDMTNAKISFHIVNNGHIPAGRVTMLSHMGIFKTVPIKDVPQQAEVISRYWVANTFKAVPIGDVLVFNADLLGFNQAEVSVGHQNILFVGTINYNDGFPSDPSTLLPFCVLSVYSPATNAITMSSCDPEYWLPEAIKADKYPSPKYKRN
jgi:hypothetical protein